jgi:mRNA-degrading endonuclease RelE of RelBE toxin-antitoxin system
MSIPPPRPPVQTRPRTWLRLTRLDIGPILGSMAAVLLTPEAQEEFDVLPAVVKERMRNLFRRLAKWPDVSGAKALTGDLAGSYRLRTGDYRLRFRVKGGTVLVHKIGHRKDVYED